MSSAPTCILSPYMCLDAPLYLCGCYRFHRMSACCRHHHASHLAQVCVRAYTALYLASSCHCTVYVSSCYRLDHASRLAQFVAVNCSCNCLSPKVLVLSKNWPHYQEFVSMLKEELGMH